MFKQTLLILFSTALTFALVFALSLSVTPGQAGAAASPAATAAADVENAAHANPSGYAKSPDSASSAGASRLSAAPGAGSDDASAPTAEESSDLPPALRSPIVQFAAALVCVLFALMAVLPLFVVDRGNGL